MNFLRGSFRYDKETPQYKIRRSTRVSAPHVLVASLNHTGSNYELLTDLIKDTEKFIIERMLKLVLGSHVEAKDRKAAISFCLKSFDKLTQPQCVSVLNAAYRMLGRKGTPNDIRVKLAEELRAFTGGSKGSKSEGINSYEKMLAEDGEVELDG
jgi:hypothetical protein